MFGKEPAVILGALAEVVKAVIPALIIFGILRWTPEQVAAVMFVVGVLVTSLTVILTRTQTVSNGTADAQIVAAKDLPTSVSDVEAIRRAKAATK